MPNARNLKMLKYLQKGTDDIGITHSKQLLVEY